MKLEFGASVGFIHKESVTMHGHMIVKFKHFVRISTLTIPQIKKILENIQFTS